MQNIYEQLPQMCLPSMALLGTRLHIQASLLHSLISWELQVRSSVETQPIPKYLIFMNFSEGIR